MVGVAVGRNGTTVRLVGQGLRPVTDFEVSPGVLVTAKVPTLEVQPTADGVRSFVDYAAVIHGQPMATLSIEVSHPSGGATLAAKAWNALYVFHRLSLATGSPCLSLYAEGDGETKLFSACSPNPILREIEVVQNLSRKELTWTAANFTAFDDLHEKSTEFAMACRCMYGAAYLPDYRVQAMLLWAGIEGLLRVDSELSRRIALYSALLLNDTEAAKHEHYDFVKKAYAARSGIVHGRNLSPDKMKQAAKDAFSILSGLLRRTVELGRVPLPDELDKLAVGPKIV